MFTSRFASNLARVLQTLTKCFNKHLAMHALGHMQTCNLFNQHKMATCQLTMMNVLVQLQLAQQQKMLQNCVAVSARNVGEQSTMFATLWHCRMGRARAFCQTNST